MPVTNARPPQLWTMGEIARRLGVPVHRVKYAVETRRIKAARRVGVVWMYGEAEVERIAAMMRAIEARREATRQESAPA